MPALSGVLSLSRTKSIKPVFHVPIFETSIQENCLGKLGFRIKTLKVTNLVISTPVTPELWGVGSRESSVGECGIIDLDFIIPMHPETILFTLVKWWPIRTLHTELRTSSINLETP